MARVNALKSGEIDGGWMLPSNAIGELKASGAGDVFFGLNSAVNSLIVSNPKGPLGNPEVRKALLMAIDRNGLVQAAEAGYATRTNSLTTESVWGSADAATKDAAFKDLVDYPYDIEAAAKIIQEQGVAGQEITITTAPMGNNFAVTAQATAAAAESIGLKAKINTVTPNAYTALFSDPAAREGTDLFFTSWYLSDRQPAGDVLHPAHRRLLQLGNWSNPEFDKATNAGLQHDRHRQEPCQGRRGAEDLQQGNSMVAALREPDQCMDEQQDHGCLTVGELPVLPMGGPNWRKVTSPQQPRRRRGQPSPRARRSRH